MSALQNLRILSTNTSRASYATDKTLARRRLRWHRTRARRTRITAIVPVLSPCRTGQIAHITRSLSAILIRSIFPICLRQLYSSPTVCTPATTSTQVLPDRQEFSKMSTSLSLVANTIELLLPHSCNRSRKTHRSFRSLQSQVGLRSNPTARRNP